MSGCFMPAECMRGYARMTERMVRRSGVPEAVYSDKHSVFRIRLARVARGGMTSCEMGLCWMVDGNGELYDPGEGVKVSLFIDVWTEEMHVERYGKRYLCVLCGVRGHRKAELVDNQKELQDLLKRMRN